MKNRASAKVIAERMKLITGVKTYGDLGKLLGGKSSQAISRAIQKNKIPEAWIILIGDVYGVSEDDLCSADSTVARDYIQAGGDISTRTINLGDGVVQAGGDASGVEISVNGAGKPEQTKQG